MLFRACTWTATRNSRRRWQEEAEKEEWIFLLWNEEYQVAFFSPPPLPVGYAKLICFHTLPMFSTVFYLLRHWPCRSSFGHSSPDSFPELPECVQPPHSFILFLFFKTNIILPPLSGSVLFVCRRRRRLKVFEKLWPKWLFVFHVEGNFPPQSPPVKVTMVVKVMSNICYCFIGLVLIYTCTV